MASTLSPNAMKQPTPPQSQPAESQVSTSLPEKAKATQKRKVGRWCLGYVVPDKELRRYALDHGISTNSMIDAIAHIARRFQPHTLFFDWCQDQPYLGIAANTSPEKMHLGTPERVQALKTLLGRDEDPKWARMMQMRSRLPIPAKANKQLD